MMQGRICNKLNKTFSKFNILVHPKTWAAFALTAMVASGCMQSDSSQKPVAASNDSIYRYSAYRYQYPPTPPVMDAGSLRQFVAQYRNNTVILEFWASWSPTSRAELSPLARVQEDAYGEGVRVIACTFDPANDWASRVVPILQSERANYPCIVVPRDARTELGNWLSEDWQYDLPARFVIDSEGRVAYKAFGGGTLEKTIDEARRLSNRGGGTVASASVGENKASGAATISTDDDKTAIGAVTLRARLVNVSTGEAESLPAIYSSSGNADMIAMELVMYLADRLDRTNNQRIAILPFAPTRQRTRPTAYGREIASRVEAGLLRKGFYDLMGPTAGEHMVEDAGLSALSIDYDPTLTRRRLGVDFVVLGWLKGGPVEEPRTNLAVDSSDENPGAD